MLRPKQLQTLSQCARTFYLSGPRCGSADGASCTCSDDDSRVPGRQSNRTDSVLKQQKKSATPSGPAAKVGSFSSKGASGPVGHVKSESRAYTVSAPNVLSIRDDAPAPHGSLVNSSRVSTEKLAKAGIPTAGVFSELINHRITATNGKGFLTPQNSTVDATRPSSTTRSSGGKSRKEEVYSSVQTSPSIGSEAGSTSSSTSAQSDPGTRTSQTGTARAKQNNPEVSMKGQRLPSGARGPRHHFPQNAKFHSGSFVSDSSSGVKVAEHEDIKSVNKFQNTMRTTRFQARGPFPVNRSANSTRTVELYFHTLQQLKWGPSAEETLNNLHCRLDAYQANQVLKLLRDHYVALGFFKWLMHQPGFKHDEHTYTTMIGILGQARQFGTIKRLLDDMKREGCHPTVVTYNRLIHSYGRANYIGEAIEVFNEMQELGYEPDRVTYCTLIDIHAKAGFLDVALDLYQKMQEVGLSPDTFTYSAMVNCLGKAGHLPAADKLFSEMIERGCVPNLVTYNIMIALQAKARNYPTAVKLYRDMQAAGFRPDKITYNIVMEVLGHCGRLDEAEAVFQEMEQDWVPDEPVYGLLVDMWGKAGNVDKARAWFMSMLDTGLRPNVPTCNSLLSAFLKAQRFSDAYDVLQNMLGMGLVPSLQTYTLLLSYCTEMRSQMGVCCELMAVTGHPAHYFLMSLPDAEPGGQNVRNHATHFLELMHSEDRESKRGVLDAVIDFLHKSNLKEEAGFIWEVAAQKNVYPDSVKEKSSSYWLINLHVMSEGTAITALSRTLAWFHRQMLASGFAPRRIDIVTGWGRRSRITGSSSVRQSVQELLHLFRFPFFTENGNSGCFVGCGEPLNSEELRLLEAIGAEKGTSRALSRIVLQRKEAKSCRGGYSEHNGVPVPQSPQRGIQHPLGGSPSRRPTTVGSSGPAANAIANLIWTNCPRNGPRSSAAGNPSTLTLQMERSCRKIQSGPCALFRILLGNKVLSFGHLDCMLDYAMESIRGLASESLMKENGVDRNSILCFRCLSSLQLKKVQDFLLELCSECHVLDPSKEEASLDDGHFLRKLRRRR